MRSGPVRLVAASLPSAAALIAFAVGGVAATGGLPVGGTNATGEVSSRALKTEVPGSLSSPGHLAFPEGPPARVTGGFGEDSCLACHWNGEENSGRGELRVSGFPEEHEAGETYDLELSLEDPRMEVAGFQVAIRRSEDEGQAGVLEVPEEEDERVGILTEGDVHFAHQLLPGIELAEGDATHWAVRWIAPEAAGDEILLHASAVAGDGDQSQWGDAVYTVELRSRPAKAAGSR